MSISDSLITWLEGYDNIKVQTDAQPSVVSTYALVKEPTINIKKYLSGKEEHTEYYQFSARLDYQTNADRVSNTSWLEGLERWVAEQNANGNLPILTQGAVRLVEITSSYYVGSVSEETSVYSITIAITYNI